MSEKSGRSAWSTRRALIRREGDVVSLEEGNDEMIFKKRGGLLNFRQQIGRQVPAPRKLARRRSILISTNGGRQGPSFRRFCSNLQVGAFPTLVRSVRRGSSWFDDRPMVANNADVGRGCREQLWRASRDFSGLPRDFGSLMSEKSGRSAWSRRRASIHREGDVVSFRDEIDEKIFKKRGGLLNFR